jgi:hypothetical protein
MRFTRRDNMNRHFNSTHENMKFIPPPKVNGYDCAPPPPPPKEIGYDYTPPPLKETGYDYTPPPPPKETGYDYTPPPPRGPELQPKTETEEPYFILKTNNPFLFWFRTETITIISCHGCIRLPV